MKGKNKQDFESYFENEVNTNDTTDDDIEFDLRKKKLDIDKIINQKSDIEISNEIVQERRTVDVPRREELDIDEIRNQKSDIEISNEIVQEQKTVDVPRREEPDIDKIRNQKNDVEISNEIVQEIKTVDNVPRMGLLGWIGGTVLLFWALALIFSIGGPMIHWLLLIAAIVFIVDMISGKSRR